MLGRSNPRATFRTKRCFASLAFSIWVFVQGQRFSRPACSCAHTHSTHTHARRTHAQARPPNQHLRVSGRVYRFFRFSCQVLLFGRAQGIGKCWLLCFTFCRLARWSAAQDFTVWICVAGDQGVGSLLLLPPCHLECVTSRLTTGLWREI